MPINIAEVKAPGERSVSLTPGRMMLAEYERQDWVVNAEPGHMIVDVMQPKYWFHMARDMKPYAHVEVRGAEGEWIAFLLVLNVGVNWAQCVLLSQHDLSAVTEDEPAEAQTFEVKWKGPQAKFAVVRIADNMVMQSGFPAKADAYHWGAQNESMMRV